VEVVESELRAAWGVRRNNGSAERKREIYVFNKADLLPDPEAFLAMVREKYPHAILTSAAPHAARRTAIGVEGLRLALRTSAQALRPIAEIRIPVTDGKLLATLHRDAEILHQEQTNGVVTLTARIEARLLGKLRHEGVEVVLGEVWRR
jgi:50S ribosomal subunit-associated GTPase HflX